ncbi:MULTISPECIES: hypothetical protein [unclassified Isoptericola]|uniref:hypothetical protein n=1 Tax=unclassified Isoptericola TaxID=2623355 RepID=UPI0036534A12
MSGKRVAGQPRTASEPVGERRFRLLTSVLAPTTVIAALLFYFGYVSLTAQLGYFGLRLSTLGFSYQEVLLRSVAVVYVPLLVLIVLAIAALWFHTWAGALVGDARFRTAVVVAASVLVAVGAAALVRGVRGVLTPDLAATEAIATTPICLGFGSAAIAYGVSVLDRARRRSRAAPRPVAMVASAYLVAGFVVVALFWAANSFAAAYGRGQAEAQAGRTGRLPAVVLDTKDLLLADYPGIAVEALPCRVEVSRSVPEGSFPTADELCDAQRFHYRYTGLRLLDESGGRMFLVPDGAGWDPDTSAVMVVPADADVRLQFYPTAGDG